MRQVAQELFISRKVDTTLLIQGIDALKQIADKLSGYCSDIPTEITASRKSLKSTEQRFLKDKTNTGEGRFVHLSQIKDTTFI